MMNTAGLIAAAGNSSRMKSCKALLRFESTTFIEHHIQMFADTKISPIFVTIPDNFHQKQIQIVLQNYPVIQLKNLFPHLGLIGSIRSCLLTLSRHAEKMIITPVDCPLLSANLLIKMQHTLTHKPVIIPTFQDKWGHPILISRRIFQELQSTKTDEGLKQFLKSNRHLVHELPWHDDKILHNINTPEDYLLHVAEKPSDKIGIAATIEAPGVKV